MTAVTLVLVALALDAALGEPRRFHPLVGFGRLAQATQARLYGPADMTARKRRWRGLLAVAILIAPFALVAAAVRQTLFGAALDVMLLYFAIGWKSLGEHAVRVRDALRVGDLPAARAAVGLMVSRDTEAMNAGDVSKAAIESVLENGNDAIFGAILWFVIAGGAGALAYRLANTLDAMWGYRTARYRDFGWAAARLDDVLNFIPARFTALSYALAGRTRPALACWRAQGVRWKSPNAGPVMAAGAGSLGIVLGGPACYHGEQQMRPALGCGRAPASDDIDGALALIRWSLAIWMAVLLGGSVLVRYVLP
ncbi:MAG TPA: adenosylcobinamide-phosphate synthase CbiB [Candidatus Binataceae bacterium]|nr:adenosylcobinamide-phosphate synthase CbiB [Candidatus Binataceae bacterium]